MSSIKEVLDKFAGISVMFKVGDDCVYDYASNEVIRVNPLKLGTYTSMVYEQINNTNPCGQVTAFTVEELFDGTSVRPPLYNLLKHYYDEEIERLIVEHRERLGRNL